MNAYLQALENVLFLIQEGTSCDAFENGVRHQGIDEGEIMANEIIGKATQVLFNGMNETEREMSPLFYKDKSNV